MHTLASSHVQQLVRPLQECICSYRIEFEINKINSDIKEKQNKYNKEIASYTENY